MESENGRVVILQSPVARRMRGAGKNWAGGLRQITRRMRWEMYNAGGEKGKEREGEKSLYPGRVFRTLVTGLRCQPSFSDR